MNKKINDANVTRASIEALVICDLAQITQDGKLNIVGVFERIYAQTLPIRYPRFFIVGMLMGNPLSYHTVSFSITNPRGEHIIRQYEMSTRLGYNGKANVLNDLKGTVFEEIGIYTMTMTLDNSVTRRYQFELLEASDDTNPLKHPLSN